MIQSCSLAVMCIPYSSCVKHIQTDTCYMKKVNSGRAQVMLDIFDILLVDKTVMHN